MRWFRNLNTHNQLLLAFALLTLLAASASGYTIFTAIQLRQTNLDIQTQAEYLEDTTDAQADFQGLVEMWRNYWLTGSRFYQGQASRYQQQLENYMRHASIAAQNSDQREDLETLKSLLAAHAGTLEQISTQIGDSPGSAQTPPPSGAAPPQDGASTPPPTPSMPAGAPPPATPQPGAPSGPPATPLPGEAPPSFGTGNTSGQPPPGAPRATGGAPGLPPPPASTPTNQPAGLAPPVSGSASPSPLETTPGAPPSGAPGVPGNPPASDQQKAEQPGGAGIPPAGFVSEDILRQADQSAWQVQVHLENMVTKRHLVIVDLSEQATGLARWLVIAAFFTLFLLSALAVLAAQVARQVAEPILHLTNAVVSFENNVFQAEQLERYNRAQNELGQLARSFTGMATSMIESIQAKDQIIHAAARFVPTQYLDLLEKNSIVDIRLGDHVNAEMAVLFSDVRGFTTLSERMTPQQNFDFVNEYLKLVSPIIQRHDGFIVKFLGDGMMAIFPYGTDSAVLAGIEQQQAVQQFNAEMEKLGKPPIQAGIGVHTGHMMVGIVGEEFRMEGDAFSDTVNLTARVEGLNKYFGTSMIITTETLLRLQTPIPYQMRFLGNVEVKGRSQPIGLYEIIDGQSPQGMAVRLSTRDDFERGLKAYQAGHFSQAREYFSAVLRAAPDDQAAALYVRQAEEWSGQDVPENWMGVIVMKDK